MCFFFFLAVERIRRWFRIKKCNTSLDNNEGNQLIQIDCCEEEHDPPVVFNENMQLVIMDPSEGAHNPLLVDSDENNELNQTDAFGFVTQKLVPYEEVAPELRLPPIDYGDLKDQCTDL